MTSYVHKDNKANSFIGFFENKTLSATESKQVSLTPLVFFKTPRIPATSFLDFDKVTFKISFQNKSLAGLGKETLFFVGLINSTVCNKFCTYFPKTFSY